METVIGKVESLEGKFFAIDKDENIVALSHGDEITEGMTVFGDESNSASDAIDIAMVSGNQVISLSGASEQLFDESLIIEDGDAMTAALSEESVSGSEGILAALEEENANQEEDIDETAAGEEDQETTDGRVGVFDERDGASTNVVAGLRDNPFTPSELLQPQTEIIPPVDSTDSTPPTIGTASIAADEDDISAAGNAGGIGDLATESLTGTLSNFDYGVDGPGDVVLTAVADTGLVTLAGNAIETVWNGTDHVLTGKDSVTGADVFKLTLTEDASGNPTGAYTFALLAPVEHTAGSDENDVEFDIGVTITDAGGESASSHINVLIDDDTPIATNDGVLDTVDDNATDVVIGTVAGITSNDSFGADGGSGIVETTLTGDLGGTVTVDSATGNLVYTSGKDITDPYNNETETFTYTIIDNDGDTTTATFKVILTDEGPEIGTPDGAASIAADEDDISAAGNAGGIGDLATESLTGTLSNFDYGIDGPGDVVLTAVADTGLTTLAGNAVETVWNGTNHVLTGKDSVTGADVFTLTLTEDASGNPTGAYTFALLAPVEHAAGSDENDATFEIDITITDKEGEAASSHINVLIDDDTPTVDTNTTVQLDDDALTNGIAGGTGDDVEDTAPITGTLAHNYGADGQGTVLLLDTGAPTGFEYDLSTDSKTLTVYQGDVATGTAVLEVVLTDTTSGDYTVKQLAPIAHAAGLDENNVEFTTNYQVTDSDGDTVDGSMKINVDDDTPTVDTNTTVQLDDDALTNGIAGGTGDDVEDTAPITGTLAHNYGADGQGTVLLLDTGAPTGFEYDLSTDSKTLTVYQGDVATGTAVLEVVLTDTTSGDYTVKQLAPIAHAAGLDENNVEFTTNYQVTDSDGDTVDGSMKINVDDDTPTVDTNTTVQLDDDALTNGIAGGTGDDVEDTAPITGTLAHNYGADGQGTVLLLDTGAPTGFEYDLSTDSKTLTVYQGDVATGTAVLEVVLTDTTSGDYTVKQLAPIAHAAGLDENNVEFTTNYQVTDSDGDTVDGSMKINVDDDTPTVDTNTTVQLDDDALTNGIAGGTGDDVEDTAPITGTLAHNYGADGQGTVLLLDTGAPTGFEYDLSTDSKTLTVYQGDVATGTAVLEVVLTDTTSGDYTVKQLAPIAHAAGLDENNVEFTTNYQVTDSDGDTVDGSMKINVDDDTPTVDTNTTVQLDDDALTNGIAGGTGDDVEDTAPITGTLAHNYGADGQGTVLLLDTGAPTGFEYDLSTDSKTLTVYQGDVATGTAVLEVVLTDTTSGDYTVKQLAPIAHAAGLDENNVEFTTNYQVTDSDGDTVDGSMKINVDDDTPTVDTNTTVQLDDDALTNGIAGGTGDDVEDTAPITGTLAHNYGADGQGTVLLLDTGAPTGFEYDLSTDSKTLTVYQGDVATGTAVLEVVLTDTTSGDYTVKQLAPIAHAAGLDENNVEFTTNYQVTDSDGDTVDGSMKINVDDDTPTVDTNTTVQLDDDALTNGIAGGTGDDVEDTAPITGTLAHNYGADGQGTVLLLDTGAPTGFEYDLSTDSKTLTVYQGDVATGTAVLEVVLTDTTSGDYTVKQLAPIAHAAGLDENNVEFTTNYQVTDSDGDTVDGSMKINVDDDTPTVDTNTTVQLDDDALADGIAGGPGDDADAVSVKGILAHSYGADGEGTVLLLATGAPTGFTYTLNADSTEMTISQDSTGDDVVTVTLDNTTSGGYTVTQLAPIDHGENVFFNAAGVPINPTTYTTGDVYNAAGVVITEITDADTMADAVANYENNVEFSVNYDVTDADGDTVSGNIAINVDDDTPTASETTAATCEASVSTTPADVVLILDRSGSLFDDRDAVIAGVKDLFDTGAVNSVFISSFSGDANAESGNWYTDLDDALDAVTDLYAVKGGWTDYDAGLHAVVTNFTAPPPGGDRLVSVFMSDGAPNQDSIVPVDSDGIVGQEEIDWIDFLSTNGFDASYAIGVAGANEDQLEPIAWSPGENASTHTTGAADSNVETLTSLANFGSALISTITTPKVASGSLLDTASSGADGWADVPVYSVDFGGNTHNFTSKADSHTFDLGSGVGSVEIFGNGDYEFTGPATALTTSMSAVVTYTLEDADGDKVESDLTLTAYDKPSIKADEDDIAAVVGNAGGIDDLANADVSLTGTLVNFSAGGDAVLTAVADTGLTTLAGNAVETVWDDASHTLTGKDSVTGSDVFTLTLTEDASGNPTGAYTFALLAPIAHAAGSDENDAEFDIGVTTTDKDGVASSCSINVLIDDDTPIAVPDTGSVDEGATLTVAAIDGVLQDNDTSGADDWIAPDAGVVGVAVGDTSANLDGTGVATAIAGTYGTLTLAADGSYKYVADANITTANPQDVFTYTVKDGDGDLTHTTLTIDINDINPVPTSISEEHDLDVCLSDTNLVITLDVSGSMTDDTYGGMIDTTGNGIKDSTRLELARDAIVDMINAYANNGTVNVQLTTFGVTASTTAWMSSTAALAYITDPNNIDVSEDATAYTNTNYEASIESTVSNFTDPNPSAKTIGYFISDGQPTVEINDGINEESGLLDSIHVNSWTNFVNSELEALHVVGIGPGVINPSPALETMAVGTTPVYEANDLDITNTLGGGIDSVTGNLYDNIDWGDYPGSPLVEDVGAITSIVIDGVTYYENSSLNTVTSTYTYNPATEQYTFDTGQGKLEFNFVDSPSGTIKAGDYKYTNTENDPTKDYTEVMTLTATDSTGDTTDYSLTVNVTLGECVIEVDPIAPDLTTLVVDEAALAVVGSNPSSDAEVDSETITFTKGSEAFDTTSVKFAALADMNLRADTDEILTSDEIVWVRTSDTTLTGYIDGDASSGTEAINVTLGVPLTQPANGDLDVTVTATLVNAVDHELDTATLTDINDVLLSGIKVVAADIDGDTAVADVSVKVIDDVPTIDFTNAIGSVNNGTYTGAWNQGIGADDTGVANTPESIVLNSVKVAGFDATAIAFNYSTGMGSFTHSGGETEFKLTLNNDSTYTLEMLGSTSIITIDYNEFKGVVAPSGPVTTYELTYEDGSTGNKLTAEVYTEKEFEPMTLLNLDAVGTHDVTTIGNAINASTDGIGVDNNILESYYDNQSGDKTTESLYYNPTDPSSSVTLYFTGSGTNEFGDKGDDVIYLTAYGTKGEVQTILLSAAKGDYIINAGGTFTEISSTTYSGGVLTSYTVDLPVGWDAIDNLQVTAGFEGNTETNVKIAFGFSTSIETVIDQEVEMDFTATIIDADNDMDTVDFKVITDSDDNIVGTSGDDYIDGGAGADTIDAGAGDDTIVYDPADTVIDGGAGYDTLAIDIDGSVVLDFSTTNIESIEALSLEGAVQNLTLSLDDVLDMTDADINGDHTLDISTLTNDADTLEIDSTSSTNAWTTTNVDGDHTLTYTDTNTGDSITLTVDDQIDTIV